MIDDERDADGADQVVELDQTGGIEVKLDMPAERRDSLDGAADVAEVRGAAKMAQEIEAHAAHAGFGEALQVGVRLATVEQGHATVAAATPIERFEHRAV